MTDRDQYMPGAGYGAEMRMERDGCTLVLVREFKCAPEKVSQALTEPAYLSEWTPFDVDGSMGVAGATVKLATVGAPPSQGSETTVTLADSPRVVAYNWGGQEIRWELEDSGEGTRLTLLQAMGQEDLRYVTWAAAGWHLCIDVLERLVTGRPIGRIVGPEAMKFDWPRLNVEYAKLFGVEAPIWPPKVSES